MAKATTKKTVNTNLETVNTTVNEVTSTVTKSVPESFLGKQLRKNAKSSDRKGDLETLATEFDTAVNSFYNGPVDLMEFTNLFIRVRKNIIETLPTD